MLPAVLSGLALATKLDYLLDGPVVLPDELHLRDVGSELGEGLSAVTAGSMVLGLLLEMPGVSLQFEELLVEALSLLLQLGNVCVELEYC